MRKVDLVVIGGGAAGMAAAVSAYRSGVKDVLYWRETIIWEACSSSASTMDSVCIGSRRISPAWSSPENTVIWWRN